MGGLLSSIFDLAAGNPTQGEQNQFGALSGYQTGVGEGLITPAAQYEENILSGDPTKTAQAMAPEISANQQQTQQFKNQTAEFSPRSGGTAASVANADTSGRSNLIDLLGKEQSGAASTSLSAGSGLLDSASSNLGQEAKLADQWRQSQVSDIGQIGQSAAEIAQGLAGGSDGWAETHIRRSTTLSIPTRIQSRLPRTLHSTTTRFHLRTRTNNFRCRR